MTFVLNTFQNILHIISGGLLGVFVGMSILSVFEFLFWLLQVPWRICSRANMTTQQEIVETRVTHENTLNIDDIRICHCAEIYHSDQIITDSLG